MTFTIRCLLMKHFDVFFYILRPKVVVFLCDYFMAEFSMMKMIKMPRAGYQ